VVSVAGIGFRRETTVQRTVTVCESCTHRATVLAHSAALALSHVATSPRASRLRGPLYHRAAAHSSAPTVHGVHPRPGKLGNWSTASHPGILDNSKRYFDPQPWHTVQFPYIFAALVHSFVWRPRVAVDVRGFVPLGCSEKAAASTEVAYSRLTPIVQYALGPNLRKVHLDTVPSSKSRVVQ
jgi:hypothetical protein